MSDPTTTQRLLFPDLLGKRLDVRFDLHHGSSDGGAVLLKAMDRRLGLLDGLVGCLCDERQPGKVRHELIEMLSQRVYGLACGYSDCNDAGRLADDPVFKGLIGRDPIEGEALASQSTLSRFENSVGPRDLYRMAVELADRVIERHRLRKRGKVRRITVDLDVTDDETHGAQQLALFNGLYRAWCYLPLLGFLRFDDEPEQYLFTAMLRPGNAPTKLGCLSILRRILVRLREAFPRARLTVRLDGGFACPELFEFLDDEPKVDYVVAMGKNQVLEQSARRLMAQARRLNRHSGETERLFGVCSYKARKWSHPRRTIIKAEVTQLDGGKPKDNPRFVVTSLKLKPENVYQKYRHRGEIENRIKELQIGLEIDRTSCTRFWANQFRVLLTASAYVLMQELRLRARRTSCARAQVWTLRQRLLKLGSLIEVSVRRVLLRLPAAFPYQDAWCRIAGAVGARAG